ncbi:MAG: sugar ABC transporter permease [Actinomycetota bacterium]|nr:sugar ABC transporter permease [Actinomycetota bacterium]
MAKVFLAPSVVTMTLVAAFPIFYAVIVSFWLYLGREQVTLGLDNYVRAFIEANLVTAFVATMVFTVVSVTFEFVIGMGFALIMNQAFRGRGITRAAILIPWVIPTVIAAMMWQFMFNVSPGTVNWLLPFVSDDFNWLGESGWAMFTIIFADVWKTAPFVALLLLAGLQTIPGEVYESARVDGATAWQRFYRVTLPLLRPAMLVALLFRTVEALRVFDLPFVMTGGTSGTETLSILVQRYVIQTVDPGLASSLSTLTFILVLSVGVMFVTLLGRQTVIGE